LASCAVNPVTGKSELMLLSDEQEIKLGKRTDTQIIKEYGIYDDPELNAYVNRLCQRLAALSHRPDLHYQAKVLDVSVVNAFAVPGGYVYFTRGILAYLNSEAELAGVVGHELGHITARHSAQQYSRAQLAQIGLGIGMVLSDTLRDFSELAQFGVGALFLKFSRDNERQADDLGVDYASKAGYDASRLAEFFGTLERLHPKTDRSGLPTWLSTHPNPVDRQGAVRRKAGEWQQRLGLSDWKVDRDPYLSRIDGMVFGEDPRQGYVEDNVFYHPELGFQFPVPADWKLQNTPSAVGMQSKRKDAAIHFSITKAYSPTEAAKRFVRESRTAVIDSGRLQVNGLPAFRLLSQLRSREGVLEVLSYFIQKDNLVYVFHAYTSVGLFHGYRPTFETTIMGFRGLSDPSRINVRPDRIRIYSTQAEGTLRAALLALGVSADELEKTAVLNGKNLGDRIPANTLLKVIEKG
jgi:predicted Zn-dependent protease